ncbi:hypothetical protein JKP88DRAFT_281575 [Tribonema minus]|uniref:SET domain-containing protein n=1 Tax=Tribonema minus TaxID=303371 RepID=A0A835YN68_9STRA|nr:hypothetical protein JKP88DRAFT_281575 [Tribonema minus]
MASGAAAVYQLNALLSECPGLERSLLGGDTKYLRLAVRLVLVTDSAATATATDALQSHLDAIFDDNDDGDGALAARLGNTAAALRRILPAAARLGNTAAALLLARLHANAMTVTSVGAAARRTRALRGYWSALRGGLATDLGVALFPRAAMLNHACAPNCHWRAAAAAPARGAAAAAADGGSGDAAAAAAAATAAAAAATAAAAASADAACGAADAGSGTANIAVATAAAAGADSGRTSAVSATVGAGDVAADTTPRESTAPCVEVRVTAAGGARAGDPLRISYIDTHAPRAERRAALAAHYHFACACARCAADPAAAAAEDAALRAWRCPASRRCAADGGLAEVRDDGGDDDADGSSDGGESDAAAGDARGIFSGGAAGGVAVGPCARCGQRAPAARVRLTLERLARAAAAADALALTGDLAGAARALSGAISVATVRLGPAHPFLTALHTRAARAAAARGAAAAAARHGTAAAAAMAAAGEAAAAPLRLWRALALSAGACGSSGGSSSSGNGGSGSAHHVAASDDGGGGGGGASKRRRIVRDNRSGDGSAAGSSSGTVNGAGSGSEHSAGVGGLEAEAQQVLRIFGIDVVDAAQ